MFFYEINDISYLVVNWLSVHYSCVYISLEKSNLGDVVVSIKLYTITCANIFHV